MATDSRQNASADYGVIILGNSGAGKSYLCNLLLGKWTFDSRNSADAVTTATRFVTLEMYTEIMHIADIPGLVEPDQSAIDRNKREIMKAFEKAPNSVVLFVWTNVSGRVQSADGVAFNAIIKAYDIKKGSIIFVVNQIPDDVESDYQEKFIARLKTIIKSMEFTTNDIIFIRKIKSDEKQLEKDTRLKLYNLIKNHPAQLQTKKGPICLEADKIAQLEEDLKKKIAAAEQDRLAFEKRIKEIKEENDKSKELANSQVNYLKKQMENVQEDLFFTHLGRALDSLPKSIATTIELVKDRVLDKRK